MSRRQTESYETARYVEWLRDHPVLFCGTIGGIHASIPAKVRAKREGYQRGIPDIMVYERAGTGETFLIPNPRLSLAQVPEVQAEVTALLGLQLGEAA